MVEEIQIPLVKAVHLIFCVANYLHLFLVIHSLVDACGRLVWVVHYFVVSCFGLVKVIVWQRLLIVCLMLFAL